MVRDPWAMFAFGVIAWIVVAERPPKSPRSDRGSPNPGYRP